LGGLGGYIERIAEVTALISGWGSTLKKKSGNCRGKFGGRERTPVQKCSGKHSTVANVNIIAKGAEKG